MHKLFYFIAQVIMFFSKITMIAKIDKIRHFNNKNVFNTNSILLCIMFLNILL